MNTAIFEEINQMLEISLPVTISEAAFKNKLTDHINYLINHDFEKLVYYLYRVDVNEMKMKELLAGHAGENAAGLIAGLILERQAQKIKSRQQFRQRDNDIDENEKW